MPDTNLSNRIIECIRRAQIELLIRKAKLGEPVVFADSNGMPVVLTGEEALKRANESLSRLMQSPV